MDELTQYRTHLRRAGYAVKTSRHTERSRAKATYGQRRASYTVTLTWPDGRVTSHNAPDSLALAYRLACQAVPEGVPQMMTAPLLDTPPPCGDVPLRPRPKTTAPHGEEHGPPPRLF